MDEPNGQLIGHKGLRGLNSKANGHLISTKRAPAPSRGPGVVARGFSIIARLLTWYTILTILFRCPASLDHCDETTPKICVPYFQVKSAISPHLTPYYDEYAAPYIKAVEPYYNAVDQNVLLPARFFTAKYCYPRISQVQALGRTQWEKSIEPQLVKYRDLAKTQYATNVAPHVDRASVAVAPYLDLARTNALQTYHEIVLPSYEFVQPYVMAGYETASDFATETAIPSVTWALDKMYLFLDNSVWPHVRRIYAVNVEPQLLRIGERLGRYKEHTVVNSTPSGDEGADQKPSTFKKPARPSKTTISSPVSKASSAVNSPSAEASAKGRNGPQAVSAPPAEKSETDARRIARETVAEDLEQWQSKFAKAADEEAEVIEGKLNEVCKDFLDKLEPKGELLLTEFEDAIKSNMATLRQDIITIVEEAAGKEEGSEEKIVAAVRRAGIAIKEMAEGIRTFREKFDEDLQAGVTKSADSHFRILAGVRDLALQKIGMKWAWMDGVTYKDWAKFHALRDLLDEWMADLKALIMTHEGLQEALEMAADLEDAAMDMAREAALELARLKDVARWKLLAGDSTDNFESEAMRLAAEAAGKLPDGETTAPKVEDVAESSAPESSILEQVADAVSAPSSTLADGPSSLENLSETAANAMPDPIPLREDTATFADSAKSFAADALSSASQASSPGSAETSSLSSTTQSDASAATSSPGDLHSPDTAAMPSMDTIPEIVGNTSQSAMPVSEEDDTTSEDAVEMESGNQQPTSSIKSAFLGAAAQSVPSRQPILDDEVDIPAAVSSLAHSVYSNAVSRASRQFENAMSVVSAQVETTPKPVHEQMFSSVSSAYTAAVASASSRMSEALAAASSGVYGTSTTKPLPTFADWGRIEAIAAEKLQEGRLWAELQYESAKIALGLATPTPTSSYEKLMEQARYNYYAGLGLAHDRYTNFLSAASSALSSLTATPTHTDLAGSASSIASVARESAASAASAASDKASSVASVAGEQVIAAKDQAVSAASIAGDTVASVAAAANEQVVFAKDQVVSAANAAGENVSEVWEALISQASVKIYGEPTPTAWYESLYSAADAYASSATDAVSGGLSSVTGAAGSYGAAATSQASAQYSAVSSLISELIYGKEPSFTESVMSRLSAAYSTASASASSLISAASSVATEASKEYRVQIENIRDEL